MLCTRHLCFFKKITTLFIDALGQQNYKWQKADLKTRHVCLCQKKSSFQLKYEHQHLISYSHGQNQPKENYEP
jgi:hypothetical protein